MRLLAGDHSAGPGVAHAGAPALTPLQTASPVCPPRPLTCRLWLWAWARAPHARSRFTPSSTSALAVLGSTPCLSSPEARVDSRRSRAAASAHSRAARAPGDWLPQLWADGAHWGLVSWSWSPYPGVQAPWVIRPRRVRSQTPIPSAVGAQIPQPTSPRGPDHIAHRPWGVPTSGFSCEPTYPGAAW